MANEFAAVVIKNLDHLISKLRNADVEIAQELLYDVENDAPRPAWNTGQLRSSGAAYIGGTLVATTSPVGPNPKGSYAKSGYKDWQKGSATDGVQGIKKMTAKHLGSGVATIRGRITIIYHSPVAALMHEWRGKFSDELAEANYITAKMTRADLVAYKVLKRII